MMKLHRQLQVSGSKNHLPPHYTTLSRLLIIIFNVSFPIFIVDIYSYGIAYIHIHNTVNVAETEIFPRHIFEAFRYLPDFFLELIKNSLGKDGYLITVCQNADDVDIKKLHFYDLILLDVMMPGTDGFEFCKQIRNMVDCPILFLTAKTLEEDILFGLGIGADDYITKPFRIQELRARVAAHLRREKREHHSTLSFEPDIRFDLSAKVLYVSEQPVPLTKSEYSICEYLAKNRGQVFTKEQIYEAVFGFDGIGDNSTISKHIKNIRAKLEHFKISPISTLWGIGYKWE